MTTYVLAGGCFWCLDAVYRRIKGVTDVVSGYAGGTTPNPTYYEVATGTTGYAEAVQITFDESVIPSNVVLDIFFLIHDPTTLNRQGADVGTQYRSAMFFSDQLQRSAFEDAIDRARVHWNDSPIVTELSELSTFYDAEPEHQDYFNKNPESGYCQVVVSPKLSKAKLAYKQWMRD